MRDDTSGRDNDASRQVAAEVTADEWWPNRMNGTAARVAAIGGTGAVVFAACTFVARAASTRTVQLPWTEVAVYMVAAVVAIAGMVLVAVMDARASRAIHTAVSHEDDGAHEADSESLTRFQVDTRTGRRMIPAADVEWLEAQGNYARLHLAGESFLYRLPLARLETRLDDRHFMRVHRSAIVNLDAIRRIEPLPSGDAELTLVSGARVRLSRRYATAFHARTGRA